MENEEDSLLNNIEQRLLKLRDPKKEDYRYGTCYELLDYLNYTKRLSMREYDAFLIKAVYQVFAESTPDADIVLMALGLLDGYDYRVILKQTDRRIKFLKETTYLSSKKPSYDEVDKGRRESYEKTIREYSENPKLHLLAKFLESIQNQVDEFLEDIDNYINGKMVILPTPNYIKADNMKRKAKEAVIKYSYLGKETFTTRQEIVIKDNECQIEVNLSNKLANRLARSIALAVSPLVLIIVLAGVMLSNYTQNLGSNPPQSSNITEGWIAADAKSDKNL